MFLKEDIMNLVKKQTIAIFFTFFLSVNVFAMETVTRNEGTGESGPSITFNKGYYTCTKYTNSGKIFCYDSTELRSLKSIPKFWFYRLAREYVEQEKRKKEKSSAEAIVESPLIQTDGKVSGINTAGISAAQNIGYRIPYDVPELHVSRIIQENPEDYNKARTITDLLLGENIENLILQ